MALGGTSRRLFRRQHAPQRTTKNENGILPQVYVQMMVLNGTCGRLIYKGDSDD